MTITGQTLHYRGDDADMEATLYVDTAWSGRRPGVLVYPEGLGPGPNVHDRARRLVEAGYAALVCDLHGGGRVCSDMTQIRTLLGELHGSPARTRARALGALDLLAADDRVDPNQIAAIGHCFGGTMALELGRSGAAVAAIVGFHSGLSTAAPDDAANIKGKVLVCIGADDPYIPPEQRLAFEAEMRAGKVDWTMHLYGGVAHSFTNPDADAMGMPDVARYDADADRQSWDAMMALFARVFQAN